MKKISTFVFFLALSFNALATTWTVNVQNFSFSPSALPNVFVGDTVKWQWVNGDHTTTSLVIPAGAQAWDQALHVGNQTFSYIVTTAGSYSYKCTPHFPGMEGSFTANIIGITPISGVVPDKYNLSQNYPNPFNPTTDIRFDIPNSANVKLSVMNIVGQEIEVLVDGQLNAGSYTADWNAAEFPSGVYIYKLTSGEFSDTKKMILIK